MTKLTDEELMDIDDYGNRELYTRAEVLMARELLAARRALKMLTTSHVLSLEFGCALYEWQAAYDKESGDE